MKEEEIYIGLLNRDEEVYNWLMTEYSKLLWAVASTIISGRNQSAVMDLEEVVSDVFIRLWKNPEKYRPERGSLKSYLAVMAKSLALNKVKKKQKDPLYLHDNAAEEEVQLPEISKQEEWQALYEAIRQLEEPTREIMIRRFFYEEKPKTIRKDMKLTAKEVDNSLYRGKLKLKKILEYQNFIREVNQNER